MFTCYVCILVGKKRFLAGEIDETGREVPEGKVWHWSVSCVYHRVNIVQMLQPEVNIGTVKLWHALCFDEWNQFTPLYALGLGMDEFTKVMVYLSEFFQDPHPWKGFFIGM